MSVVKVTEISAASPNSFEDAVKEGITRANKTIRNIKGAWIKEQKLDVENGKIVRYRVSMKLSFELD
jgi:flavin-binding protein dodecin